MDFGELESSGGRGVCCPPPAHATRPLRCDPGAARALSRADWAGSEGQAGLRDPQPPTADSAGTRSPDAPGIDGMHSRLSRCGRPARVPHWALREYADCAGGSPWRGEVSVETCGAGRHPGRQPGAANRSRPSGRTNGGAMTRASRLWMSVRVAVSLAGCPESNTGGSADGTLGSDALDTGTGGSGGGGSGGGGGGGRGGRSGGGGGGGGRDTRGQRHPGAETPGAETLESETPRATTPGTETPRAKVRTSRPTPASPDARRMTSARCR